ncbi:MAG: hypothetical protein AAF962_03205 [Actinomycetota bacterium]
MTSETFDRTAEDVGNIVLLEHVNVTVPDERVASLFYVHALGLTRDPYITYPTLTWINVGAQQFHLPTGDAQVIRGVTEVVVPDVEVLERRLARAAKHLAGTEFAWERVNGPGDEAELSVRGPWGNRLRCRAPAAGAAMELGMASVEFPVSSGAAEGVAAFYREVLGAPATVEDGLCVVDAGPGQALRFRETDEPLVDYDGHHLAIYIADFSGPHRRLFDRDLIVEESNDHQYRFNWIVDPASGQPLFEIEHEVRSLSHPLFGRPLVNRNPEQGLQPYRPGLDTYRPGG